MFRCRMMGSAANKFLVQWVAEWDQFELHKPSEHTNANPQSPFQALIAKYNSTKQRTTRIDQNHEKQSLVWASGWASGWCSKKSNKKKQRTQPEASSKASASTSTSQPQPPQPFWEKRPWEATIMWHLDFKARRQHISQKKLASLP